MAEPYRTRTARSSVEGIRLLKALALDRDEFAQAIRVVEACRQRRALTIQRCTAHGISLSAIAETAEISRSQAKQIADLQGSLEVAGS